MRYKTLLLLTACCAFFGCSTRIDLYADYKQVPIVYGILDPTADTNYVKITRAFCTDGDAYQVAVNPDLSNYPGKLDVRIVEYRNGDSVREIVLDTITIRNKEPGIFYAPAQKLYYTAEPLNLNTSSYSYSYRLKVALPDGTLTAKDDMVGNRGFRIQSLGVNFSKAYIGQLPRRFLFHPAINAKFYDVYMTFTFLEQRTPEGDSVPRTMTWKIGTFDDDYFASNTEGDCIFFKYNVRNFYETLTDFIGGDTAVVGLKRYIGDYPVEVVITAGGPKLWHYIYTNNEMEDFVPGDMTFSLMEDAYGVFSSRMTVRSGVRLGGETVPDLIAMTNYGFVFIGGIHDSIVDCN